MKWVTTVTCIWMACWLFVWGAGWGLKQPGMCAGEAALGCGFLALLALPLWGLGIVATPVVIVLWLVRLGRWMTRKREPEPRMGFRPPPPMPEPREQYTITGRRLR